MERIYSLQDLRGVAVLGVVLFHMTAVEHKYSGGDILLPSLLDFFQLGVDLFFIISDFVMVIVSRGRFQKVAESKRLLYQSRFADLSHLLVVLLPHPDGAAGATGHGQPHSRFVQLADVVLLLPNDKVLLVMVAWSLLFELWFQERRRRISNAELSRCSW